jgi:hypothetical protein
MNTKYLFLTGGLGNQLFQYSAAFSYAGNADLIIDVVNGKPRTNKIGDADLLEFQLSDSITFHTKAMPRLTRKAVGYCLRSNLSPTKLENYFIWRHLSLFVTNLLLTLHYRKIIRIQVLQDLGDDVNLVEPMSNNYLVGYFQSTRWAKQLKSSIAAKPSLKSPSKLVAEYRRLSEVEKPLIVHVRLGDYVAEGGFGIPSPNYYLKAINEHLLESKYGKIWLFSDEPQKALRLIPKNLSVGVRVIENANHSSAETLEIMRFGFGYVIANSTFSWWGAYLSYNQDSRVFYPIPWFKDQPSPNNLTPKEWEGIDAEF